jgi:hypothetical protein
VRPVPIVELLELAQGVHQMPLVPDQGPVEQRECLDRMLITGERHLRLVLADYVKHYNVHRPHRTLCQRPPAGRGRPPAVSLNARVLRRDRLGGLMHEYSQVA